MPVYMTYNAARIQKKGGGVSILLRDSLKCETHLHFQAKSFENYQLTFGFVDSLATNSGHLLILGDFNIH